MTEHTPGPAEFIWLPESETHYLQSRDMQQDVRYVRATPLRVTDRRVSANPVPLFEGKVRVGRELEEPCVKCGGSVRLYERREECSPQFGVPTFFSMVWPACEGCGWCPCIVESDRA